MKIFIHCVGKLKESYLKQAVEDYSKRIGQYCHIEILEAPDLSIPEHSSASIEEEIKEKECAAMLKSMKSSDFLVICDLQGKQMESPQFAAALSSFFIKGGSNVHFAIGGSLGLSDSIKQRANASICFSKMTFPHGLSRVILLEQIYRAFKINSHEPYHK